MKENYNSLKALLAVLAMMGGCAPSNRHAAVPEVPAYDYTAQLKQTNSYSAYQPSAAAFPAAQPVASFAVGARGQLRLVSGDVAGDQQRITNLNDHAGVQPEYGNDPGYQEFRSERRNVREYQGPLEFGQPGVSASLWRESSSESNLFRDVRALQPMDLITIIVSESSDASKEADTEVKESSTVDYSIGGLLGFQNDITQANPNITLSDLISAATTNDFKGEGDTSRKDSLTARISAMVVEVLPNGILRVEGKKIIALNSEEQVMVISGLVRPRDVSSTNEVESAKIANLRVDYYGKGIVSEAQNGGWLSRAIRVLWPF